MSPLQLVEVTEESTVVIEDDDDHVVVITEEAGPAVIEVGISGPQGPPGTLIEVSEDGSVVSSPLRELNFTDGFDVVETSPRHVDISLDLSESPELQVIIDTEHAHEIDVVGAHNASAIAADPFGSVISADVQSQLEEIAAAAGGIHPGLAAHDALGLATDIELAAGVSVAEGYTDSAVSTHAGASDPHPGYLTPTEGDAAYDVIGTAAAAITTAEGHSDAADAAHVAALDPHSQYETAVEAQALVDVHTADPSGAHAASAVAFTPDGIVSTNVQDAIDELAARVGAGPAVGSRRLISFVWNGTNWVEDGRT